MSVFTPPETFPEVPFKIKITSEKEFDKVISYLYNNNCIWNNGDLLNSNLPHLSYRYFTRDTIDGIRDIAVNRDLRVRCRIKNLSVYPELREMFFKESPILSNEEVFVIFLKHNRKFTPFKKARIQWCEEHPSVEYTTEINMAITTAFSWDIGDVPYSSWYSLSRKWNALVKEFTLKGTIDFNKVIEFK